MYELVQVSEKCYYINCPVKIGVYSLGELCGMVTDCLRKVTNEMYWTMQIGKDYKHWLETGGGDENM